MVFYFQLDWGSSLLSGRSHVRIALEFQRWAALDPAERMRALASVQASEVEVARAVSRAQTLLQLHRMSGH
jgi:hypothetical protein